MSKIEVDTIDTRSGSSTLTLGSANATTLALNSSITTLPSTMTNVPVFQARLTSNQTLSTGTFTKIQFNDTSTADLSFDPQSTYDNTTNYRFTPAIAGKYYCYGCITYEAGLNQGEDIYFQFRINGSDISQYEFNSGGSGIRHSLHYSNIFDLDADDYVEIFGYHSTGTNHDVGGHATILRTFFGACKLIGA